MGRRKTSLKKPTTIEENLIVASRNSALQKEHDNLSFKMEKWFKKELASLHWGNTFDVMYSFKSLYALGVWAYNHKDNIESFRIIYKRSIPKLQYTHTSGNRLVWNGQFLYDIQNTELVEELNKNKSIENLAKHYYSLGNLMPIWPYGNTPKGNQNRLFFDIPELYYYQHKTWFDLIRKGFDNVYLDGVFQNVGAEYDKGLEAFFQSIIDKSNYNNYLDHAVSVILSREEFIKQWMSDNRIVIKNSWDYPVD